MSTDNPIHSKTSVALFSVGSAILLTGTKLGVGLMTGSLGILAEAAHSGLDLIAAIVTFFAVKLSSKPADKEHPYGHGKIENFSALIETVLLFITCVWISFEAIERLFFTEVKVDASIWAFAVVLLSIGVDMHRSRRLLAAAKHYHSQALEADGLHFKTDIWSSCVVFAGLIFVTIAHTFPVLHFLEKADAVAALGVAFIVIFVSSKMGNRTIQNLLDRAPDGMTEEIKKLVESIPGILDCHHIRIRCSGPDIFIELHVLMDGEKPMKETHALTEVVEKRISEVYPNADTTVHAEPK